MKQSGAGAPGIDDHVVIGWREYVALPEWGIGRIMAKADSGARSSALDVGQLEELPGGRVSFDVVTRRERAPGEPGRVVHVEADVVRRTRVRSSLGDPHDRVFVRTAMTLGSVTKEIELGLVDRRRMRCRMLIGRRALQPEFFVDSGATYRLGRRPRIRRSS
ncbi:MAG: ATP-dependent zinc protease [Phycisphaerales bacterium]